LPERFEFNHDYRSSLDYGGSQAPIGGLTVTTVVDG
jgi:hypothetical protein